MDRQRSRGRWKRNALRTHAEVNTEICCSSNGSGDAQTSDKAVVWGRHWASGVSVRVDRARGSCKKEEDRVGIVDKMMDCHGPEELVQWHCMAGRMWVLKEAGKVIYAPAPVVPPARAEERIPGD